MPIPTFVSPGAAVADTLTQILTQRKLDARQALLDQMEQQKLNDEKAYRDRQIAIQEAENQRAADEFTRKTNEEWATSNLIAGQDLTDDQIAELNKRGMGTRVRTQTLPDEAEHELGQGDLAPRAPARTYAGSPAYQQQKAYLDQFSSNLPNMTPERKNALQSYMALTGKLPDDVVESALGMGKPVQANGQYLRLTRNNQLIPTGISTGKAGNEVLRDFEPTTDKHGSGHSGYLNGEYVTFYDDGTVKRYPAGFSPTEGKETDETRQIMGDDKLYPAVTAAQAAFAADPDDIEKRNKVWAAAQAWLPSVKLRDDTRLAINEIANLPPEGIAGMTIDQVITLLDNAHNDADAKQKGLPGMIDDKGNITYAGKTTGLPAKVKEELRIILPYVMPMRGNTAPAPGVMGTRRGDVWKFFGIGG